MLCDKCGKNEANVYVEKTVNGHKEKYHLCSNCAEKMEGSLPFSFNISDFLSGFSSFGTMPTIAEHKCSSCGMTFADFEEKGRLGCPSCYKDLKEELLPVIKRIHGSVKHTGEDNVVLNDKEMKIQEYKAKLSEAILKEDFENAAVLRDKIKELEAGEN